MVATHWDEFLGKMAEISDLGAAIALMTWDQETYMPPKGIAARGEQLATLQGLQHEKLVAPDLDPLLCAIEAHAKTTDEQRAILRAFNFDRDRAMKIPADLVKETARAQSSALSAWGEARSQKSFKVFAPALQRLLDLKRQTADAYEMTDGAERYDALLEGYEPGMRVSRLGPIFQRLREWLVPAIQKISDCGEIQPDFFRGDFDATSQWNFTLELLEAMGFDSKAGRQDRSVHPFTTSFDPEDVRITTRIFENLPLSSVFSTIHEAGHALYEQGLPVALRRTSACVAASMGLHESQSRLWENLVGRSEAFWKAFLPRYRKHFPDGLSNVSTRDFVVAVNRVEKSPIRVEADEVTYNVHILIRFELELQLLRGQLEVVDLATAWNDLYEASLGLQIADDTTGVLQDIHWAWGEFGYFPTYTVGNLYSASLFNAACRAVPNLVESIEAAQLTPLRDWLRENVHRWGRLEQAETIVERATGSRLNVDDFIAYLQQKYEKLYSITL